jgi:hypothetical protein
VIEILMEDIDEHSREVKHMKALPPVTKRGPPAATEASVAVVPRDAKLIAEHDSSMFISDASPSVPHS